RGVDLSNYFGIDKDNLTSANALIPIIYYLFQQDKQRLRGTSAFDKRNASNVRRWLLMALLNNVFGSSSDTMLQAIRESLNKHGKEGKDFPIDAINLAIKKKGRSTNFDEDAVDRILLLTYNESESFLALSLLYDENGWGTIAYEKDHIFPRAAFSTKNLKANGIAIGQIQNIQQHQNKLANLNLISASENLGKSDESFEKWLKSRDKSFKAKHLIPDDPKLYKIDRFLDFLDAREKLIAARLQSVFSSE
ncbi:MAG: hypothetical protein JWN70_2915, partial [Planctomycetaceae bacterium]|nr:hypothetical protein [Planctomycetaceae bacterium]